MSDIQIKNQSKPAKHAGFLPVDFSWDHMDKMFNNFRSHWPFHFMDDMAVKSNDINLNPNVDIKEDKKSYEISAELPGLDTDDISLDISDNVLTISGEKKTESKEEKGENFHVMERRYGYFKRSFSLPLSVEQEKIQASFKKGVLHVTLPKSEVAQETQRKIKIND